MNSKQNRKLSVLIRINPDNKALIQQAAEKSDLSMAGFIRMSALAAAEKKLGRIAIRNFRLARMMEEHKAKMGWNSMEEYEESLMKAGPQRAVDVMNAQMEAKQANEDLKAVPYA